MPSLQGPSLGALALVASAKSGPKGMILLLPLSRSALQARRVFYT